MSFTTIRPRVDKEQGDSNVQGTLSAVAVPPCRITAEGEPAVLAGTGGMTYNVRVGDPVAALKADHVEPGGSLKNKDANADGALDVYARGSNEARVVPGPAKGRNGVVTGKHGGTGHVLVDLPPETLNKLVAGDSIQIKAEGVGPEIVDLPGMKV